MIKALLLGLVIFLVATFPATWLLMLFLGNCHLGLSYWGTLPLGILVSVTSVGAGALGTTALLMLYPRLSVAKIAGSDIAHAVPLTLIAGIGHWLIGAVDFPLMLSLLVGSIPGVIIGSMLASRTSDKVLRPVLAVTLLIVAVRLLTA